MIYHKWDYYGLRQTSIYGLINYMCHLLVCYCQFALCCKTHLITMMRMHRPDAYLHLCRP